ncbi:hypothetical protein Taro_008300 [Colocasia esculenta]|uniref:Uncharacterized protein n=1 Tax=Colocasia esculenta TaxID=4460 RepID=A0A843TWR7_COLES|nr:hypothetical protein [Colocasia esculenta]
MLQTLRQNDEEKVNVSTQAQVVSTLDPVPRRPVCQFWTVCRHSLK